jgi:hypothetical protein
MVDPEMTLPAVTAARLDETRMERPDGRLARL